MYFFITHLMNFNSFKYYQRKIFEDYEIKIDEDMYDSIVNYVKENKISAFNIDSHLNVNCLRCKDCIMCICCTSCANCIGCANCENCANCKNENELVNFMGEY